MIARAGAWLVAAGLAAAPAQAQSAGETFVQGTWHHAGTVPGSVPGREMSFFIEWRFALGRFVQTGYPPLHSEGRYRVLFSDTTSLKLMLFEQSGNFSERDRTIEIAIDRKASTISINRGPPLRRKPASE
jgi:hypothetical protein